MTEPIEVDAKSQTPQPVGQVVVTRFSDGNLQLEGKGVNRDVLVAMLREAEFLVFTQAAKAREQSVIQVAHAMPPFAPRR